MKSERTACLRALCKIRFDVLSNVRRTCARVVSACQFCYRRRRTTPARSRRCGCVGRIDALPELPLRGQHRAPLVQLHLVHQPRRQILVEQTEERLAELPLLAQHLHLGGRDRVKEDLEGVPDALKDGVVMNADDKGKSFWVVCSHRTC